MFDETLENSGLDKHLVLICCLLSLNALAGDSRPAQTRHAPITEQLITMVDHSAELR